MHQGMLVTDKLFTNILKMVKATGHVKIFFQMIMIILDIVYWGFFRNCHQAKSVLTTLAINQISDIR